MPITGVVGPSRARPGTTARCAWWCCTPTSSTSSPVQGPLRGQVLRVQVVGDHLRRDVEQPAEVRDAVGEGAQRLGVLQVADVVGDERPPPRARQNVFFSSAPQPSTGRSTASASAHRLRRVAARARAPAATRPRTTRSTESSARVRIGAVVGEEAVGDAGEPVRGVVVAVRDRLVGDVPAGQHDRLADVAGSRWCTGCRAAAARGARLPGATDGRHGRARAPAQQHDRAPAARSARPRRPGRRAQRARRVEVGHHHRERLVLAVLARAQRRDGGVRRRPARPGGSRRGP